MSMTDAERLARSSGRVHSPEAYSYLTYLPEKRGLFCVQIFGPVPWKGGDVAAIAQDDRRDRWGHIELPEPFRERRVVLVVPPVHRRFKLLSPEEHRAVGRARRQELLELAASGNWPYCDSVEKLLAEEELENPAAIEARGEGAMEHPLNSAYRAVVNRANRLRRFVELAAPEQVLDESRSRLEAALGRLEPELDRVGLSPDAREAARF